MSVLPASYIVEQAHLQCSVYCVCPTYVRCDSDKLSQLCLWNCPHRMCMALRISCLLCNANVLVGLCSILTLATEELGIRMA